MNPTPPVHHPAVAPLAPRPVRVHIERLAIEGLAMTPAQSRQFGAKLGLPVYDTALVGYPQRMRDYNDRQRRSS